MKRQYDSGNTKRRRKRQHESLVKSIKLITAFGFSSTQTSSSLNAADLDELHPSLSSTSETEEVSSGTPHSSGVQERLKASSSSTVTQEIGLPALSIEPSAVTVIDTQESSAATSKFTDSQEPVPVTANARDPEEELLVTQSSSGIAGAQTCACPNNSSVADVITSSNENDLKNDVGFWKTLSSDEISFWIEKGPSEIQHWDGPFTASKQVYKNQSRSCSRNVFSSTKSNGETYPREWLVYFPTKRKVYCFVCKLFTKWSENDSSLAAIISHGFDDWAHRQLIQTHENSRSQRNFLLSYLTRRRGNTLSTNMMK